MDIGRKNYKRYWKNGKMEEYGIKYFYSELKNIFL